MSSKEAQIKKKIEEERLEKERRNKDIELLQQEEERLKAAALANSLDESSPKIHENEDESHFNLKPSGIDNDDWKKILADYKKRYPDKSIENNVLSFATKEDAIDFFTAQATSEPPRKFLASEINQEGNLTGFNVFSCGNKKLYQGSLSDIQDQLKADLKQKPDDLNVKQGLDQITRLMGAAPGYRAALQQARSQTPAEEPRTESSLPDPSSIRPKPPLV